MGKVRFGIRNAHYAVFDETSGTYGTPKAIPGAVQLTTEANGNSSNFYADDIVYETFNKNAGYTGSLQIAVAEDELLEDLLGYVKAENGVVYEDANAKQASFALLFEVEGNQKNTRFAFYNCKLSRPSTEANTTTDETTPDTSTLDITMIGRDMNGKNVVKGHLEYSEQDADTFNGWFDGVVTPFNQAVVGVQSVTLDKATATVAAGSDVTLTATVAPDTATDKTVTAESGDTAKATVAVKGATVTVHGVAATDANKPVTVTVQAGTKTATCAVTVTAAATK